MLLQVVLLFSFVFAKDVVGVPVREEKIAPVDLAYTCFKGDENIESNKSSILLIHGLGSSRASWKNLFKVLSLQTGRSICAVDLRNHGESPWNNRTDVAAMAADIGNFLDQRKIDKVNLIGHSLGGKVAIHYTLNNPERVDSIVVEDMRPNGMTEMALMFIQTVTTYVSSAIKVVPEGSTVDKAREKVGEYLSEKLSELGMDSAIDENTIKNLEIICKNGKCRWKMNIDLLQEAMKNPLALLTESKGVYEGPALFIYGTVSIFDIGDDESNIQLLFPKVELIAVEDAGHFIHETYREFEDEVIKFLNKLI